MPENKISNKKLLKAQQEIALLKKELTALDDARKRVTADFINFQNRVEADKETDRKVAVHHLLEKLFPVFDNFYRASHHAPEVDLTDGKKVPEEDLKKIVNYLDGLRMIEGQMESVLEEAGLKKIPTANTEFDHHLHEAVSYEPSKDTPVDFILGEIETGWTLNGQVIKPAKVRVSKG